MAVARHRLRGPRFKQGGQAVLGLLMIFGIALSVFVYNMISPAEAYSRRHARTEIALREARDALIGRAASDANRPGSMPCPDTDNDGIAELFAGPDCPSNIGRLPWKTLGLPDLRDGNGERLWYALSGRFRDNAGAEPINSDTKGNIKVYQDSTATVITNEAVAVVFAPDAPIGAQNRGCTVGVNCDSSDKCTTSPPSLTPKCNPANYLDTAAGVSNAASAGPFIDAQSSNTFNDKLLIVTTADLMTVVEQRIAHEVIALLKSYKAAVGVYPWADCSNGSSDAPSAPSDPAYPDGSNRGRIPWQTTSPVNWGSGGTPPLPAWYTNNQWSWVIYYAAGKNFLEGGGAGCGTCETIGAGSPPADGTLILNGAVGKEAVIITTGPAGASRPHGVPWDSGWCTQTDWAAYVDDPQNNDVSNDRYVTPSSTTYARDRIYTIP